MTDEPEMIDEPDCCLTRSSSWRFASDPHIDISRKIYAGMSLPSGTWLHFTTGRRGAQTFFLSFCILQSKGEKNARFVRFCQETEDHKPDSPGLCQKKISRQALTAPVQLLQCQHSKGKGSCRYFGLPM